MGYYIDIEKWSIREYMDRLNSADLLPSRRVLRDDIERRFEIIRSQNVQTVGDLTKVLKNKNNLEVFSERSGLEETYLKILIREINSNKPSPNNLKDFPGVDEEIVLKLAEHGIKNTLQLFPHILTGHDREALARKLGIEENKILWLARLTDLSRIRWVNHTFAYMLLEAGYDGAQRVADADPQTLCDDIAQLNAKRSLFKGKIGFHDMKLCVEAARTLSFEVEY